MTKKEELTYEKAMTQLEEIVQMVENNQLDIDQIGEKLKEAKTLIEYCKDRLYKTDEEVKKILQMEEK